MLDSVPLTPMTVESSGAALDRWCGSGSGLRLLAFVAHPDDDVLGFGGRLRVIDAAVHVAYVSDGAPARPEYYPYLAYATRASYAEARRREADRALRLAGVPPSRVYRLGGVDQGVVRQLRKLTPVARALIEEIAPDAVLTHPYEGGHPDHDSTACIVHLALHQVRARVPSQPPALLEFASYHERCGVQVYGEFLPRAGARERVVALDPASRALKQQMLDCHGSQKAVWQSFPLSVERFRVAPRYDFREPPAAAFLYDRMDWGSTGSEFLGHSREATRSLGITGPC